MRGLAQRPSSGDRANDADLVEAGFRVVRVPLDRLMTQRKRAAARFRRLLAPFPGA